MRGKLPVGGLCRPPDLAPTWSGREDLNLRPQRPERCALPGCATPRRQIWILAKASRSRQSRVSRAGTYILGIVSNVVARGRRLQAHAGWCPNPSEQRARTTLRGDRPAAPPTALGAARGRTSGTPGGRSKRPSMRSNRLSVRCMDATKTATIATPTPKIPTNSGVIR